MSDMLKKCMRRHQVGGSDVLNNVASSDYSIHLTTIVVIAPDNASVPLAGKTTAKRQNFETNLKKGLTLLQIANSMSTCYYRNKAIVGFADTHTSVRIYHKE
jgi:hypothetical protein